MDQEVVAFWNDGPQSGVEHPVGVGREGEAVAGIVVAADGVLMDVGGLDDRAGFRVEAIAGEGAGEIVAAEHIALEAAVAAFFLTGFECCGISPQGGDGFRLGSRQTKPGTEHDLFGGREVDADEGAAGFAAEVGVLQASEETGIEVAETGGELGFRGLSIGGETLPDLIALAAEGVERHRDVR